MSAQAPPGVMLAARFDSTRENSTVSDTQQELTDCDSSVLIPRVVPRGRSQLAESFVCSVPLARIGRLIVLDSMDHGPWPFFVDGVTCLVNSVSV